MRLSLLMVLFINILAVSFHLSKANVQAVLFAAGKSSRFVGSESKLLYKLNGKPLILYPIELLRRLDIPTIVVVGHEKEKIIETITSSGANPIFVEQPSARGTGDALACTKNQWDARHILVLNGDAPLITDEILARFITHHKFTQADCTLIVSYVEKPIGAYGRVIEQDGIVTIVEDRDFKGDKQAPCLTNPGFYLFKREVLEELLPLLKPHENTKNKEYYVTDLIELCGQKGYTVKTIEAPFEFTCGANTMEEMKILQELLAKHLQYD
ncbi:MAG TPA: NTP transferase domain-containing protein [Candidatus Babeliaceae bacterium]|nr:NTP transferase domain-containing protein [Candidatus Babeliaceae bacterium]